MGVKNSVAVGAIRSRVAPAKARKNQAQPESPTGTLTQEAYRRLEEMIVTLELAPGEVVSEAILSRRLGIGTTPIREALLRLARENLVQIIPRSGVVVTAVDVRLQLEVLETRREIDRLLVRAAARRATPAERKGIAAQAAAAARAAAVGDVRDFLRKHLEMMQWIARAARNSVASGIASPLHSVSRRFWFYHLGEEGVFPETAKLHLDVASAVVEGEPDRAGEANDRLIEHLVCFTTSTLPGN